MSNKLNHSLPSLFMAVFGVLLIIIIPFQIDEVQISMMGPRFFPYFLSIMVVLLSILSFAAEFKKQKRTEERSQPVEAGRMEKKYYWRVFLIFISLVAWIYIVPILGFILTTVIFIALVMLIIGSRKWRQILLVPTLFTLFIYYVFKMLFYVPLPEGFFY
ncbi:tripartite tricarboxylate transporter TctB family protein [Bacillus sp. FJAT-27251]|uniref:tripartite tricarboxylate transporter TctB family protein n=1 Tax=Bacillus sp. FJAT-27251 TaxID=1684142 RepID=UPI0006A78E8B|nr:tripartite tricarboxylate transporter TctB family protein [Bacillus sp. FJAT-27251]